MLWFSSSINPIVVNEVRKAERFIKGMRTSSWQGDPKISIDPQLVSQNTALGLSAACCEEWKQYCTDQLNIPQSRVELVSNSNEAGQDCQCKTFRHHPTSCVCSCRHCKEQRNSLCQCFEDRDPINCQCSTLCPCSCPTCHQSGSANKPSLKRSPVPTFCQEDGCLKEAESFGVLCRAHYKAKHNKKKPICQKEGCDKPTDWGIRRNIDWCSMECYVACVPNPPRCIEENCNDIIIIGRGRVCRRCKYKKDKKRWGGYSAPKHASVVVSELEWTYVNRHFPSRAALHRSAPCVVVSDLEWT